tara:strand:+ start:1063 stop:1530 length:468 start_codon:yes stop_codon:yes gene_type:complete
MLANNIILLLVIAAILNYFVITKIIYFLAPTIPKGKFPNKIYGKNNCTRIADNQNRGYGMEPIVTDTPINEVQLILKTIIERMPRTTIVNEKEGFLHSVQLTPFFRFHDDIFIKIFLEDKKTTIWFQSQSRLGLYDFLINERRIKHIYKNVKKSL